MEATREIEDGRRASPGRFAIWIAAAALMLGLAAQPAAAAEPKSGALTGTRTYRTPHTFEALVARVEQAVARHGMAVVATASASRGAAARGIEIPGNAVIMVFRNDFALRMLRASVPAGIEAPLRFYVTENGKGTASLTYRSPSATFAPYGSKDLAAMARELDSVFEAIAADAIR